MSKSLRQLQLCRNQSRAQSTQSTDALSGAGVALGGGDDLALLRIRALLRLCLLNRSLRPRRAVALASAPRRLSHALSLRLLIRRLGGWQSDSTASSKASDRAVRARVSTGYGMRNGARSRRAFCSSLRTSTGGASRPTAAFTAAAAAAVRSAASCEEHARIRERLCQQRPMLWHATAARAGLTARAADISAARRSARAISFDLRRSCSTRRSFCACERPESTAAAASGGATASPSARAKSAAQGWKAWCGNGAQARQTDAVRPIALAESRSHQNGGSYERSDLHRRATLALLDIARRSRAGRHASAAARPRRMLLLRGNSCLAAPRGAQDGQRSRCRHAHHGAKNGRHSEPRQFGRHGCGGYAVVALPARKSGVR